MIQQHRKHIAWTLLIILVTFLTACSGQATRVSATPTPIPTPVIPTKPTYEVQRGSVEQKLKFTGRIVPVEESELFFGIGGRVDEVLVEQGEDVEEGQLLAVLETGNREFDLKRAQAQLDLAILDYRMTELQTPSYQKTYSLTMAIKEKQVELAQINLDELNKAVADARIVSPMDGRIRSLRLTGGAVVEAFKPVIVVSDLSELEVTADVGGDTLTRLEEGMPVTILPVILEGEILDGQIVSLPYPYGSGSRETAAQSVRISSIGDLSEVGYKIGDLVEVLVLIDQSADTLWLPPQAIRTFEGRKFVVVRDDEGQRRVDIRVGLQGDDRVEILEGLKEGEIVLSP
jgi:RND family efflux transporter MFP subunit